MAFTKTGGKTLSTDVIEGTAQGLSGLIVADAGAAYPDGGEGEQDTVKVEFLRGGVAVFTFTQADFADLTVRCTIGNEEPDA